MYVYSPLCKDPAKRFFRSWRFKQQGEQLQYSESHRPLEYAINESVPEPNDKPAQKINNLKKEKINKNRRGWGKPKLKLFNIVGNNVNGLLSKWESLQNVITTFNGPSCILLQETKLKNVTKKLHGYKFSQSLEIKTSLVEEFLQP